MTTLDLTPDELLTTTRAVRKRLDLTRDVPLELVRECLEIAVQAPTGSNAQGWHFVVVTDAERRRAIAERYRTNFEAYLAMGISPTARPTGDADYDTTNARVETSASYLAQHLHDVPVFVIPCVEGRLEEMNVVIAQASVWGSIVPATWSYMLAARARGLGTCYTTLHLFNEREVAEIVGIPYEEITQAGLIPTAFYTGDTFAPGPRRDLDRIIHVNGW